MKKTVNVILALLLGLVLGCDEPARNKPKPQDKGNDKVTASYGGCQFETECTDFNGSVFQEKFQSTELMRTCETDGGHYVTNGCSYKNLMISCVLNQGTKEEMVMHVYKTSSIDKAEVIENCEMMGGVVKDYTSI